MFFLGGGGAERAEKAQMMKIWVTEKERREPGEWGGADVLPGVLFTARPVAGLQLPVSDNQAGIRYTNTQYPVATRWITAFLSDPGKRNTPAAAYQPSQDTHTHTHAFGVVYTSL